jgi:hypothetical protein
MKKRNNWPGFAVLCIALIAFTAYLPGCNHSLDPAGVYGGDKILYEADQALANSYDAMDVFLQWEFNNRNAIGVVTPAMHAAAENIRLNAPEWFRSLTKVRKAYAADPSPENRLKLENALGIVRAAMTEAKKYAPPNTFGQQPVRPSAMRAPLLLHHRVAA